jgi:hypothetical protein
VARGTKTGGGGARGSLACGASVAWLEGAVEMGGIGRKKRTRDEETLASKSEGTDCGA